MTKSSITAASGEIAEAGAPLSHLAAEAVTDLLDKSYSNARTSSLVRFRHALGRHTLSFAEYLLGERFEPRTRRVIFDLDALWENRQLNRKLERPDKGVDGGERGSERQVKLKTVMFVV